MMNEISVKSSSNNNGEETLEKTIRNNGITKRIRVEKAENGYIIVYNEYGDRKLKDGKTEYYDETKKWISKTNPMDSKKDKNTSEDSSIDSKILEEIQTSKMSL